MELADVVNTTLDLDTLLERVAEIIRHVIDYQIFAVLLLNERTQEMRFRFAIGYPREVIDGWRIKLGEGVTGQAALRREAVLLNEVAEAAYYLGGVPGVHSELAVPLIAKNKLIGVIDLEASEPHYFTAVHQSLLTLVASRVAAAIDNARLYARVVRQARSLSLLNVIARELTSILNLDELLKRIGEELKRLTDYQMFSILLLDAKGSKLEHLFSLRYGKEISIKHNVPLGRGLVGYAALHQTPVVVGDVLRDPRYIQLNPETRSELALPLLYKGKTIGVLDIEHTRTAYFDDRQVRTLVTLAAQIAIAIENARLYEAVERHEKQMERELELARELQFLTLPPACPVLRNAELFAHFLPASFIGGDLYDFVPYRHGRLGLAIGDVSGKGAAAALYAALSSGFLRSHAAREPGPAEMLEAINASLNQRPISTLFVAMMYAVWDDPRRQLRIANSGLPRPILCRNGVVQLADASGLPMGLFPEPHYEEIPIQAEPGDLVVFFSDGVIDAADAEDQMFGRARVEEVVRTNYTRSAEEVVEAIFAAVATHVGDNDPFDDQTVVALKVKDRQESGS